MITYVDYFPKMVASSAAFCGTLLKLGVGVCDCMWLKNMSTRDVSVPCDFFPTQRYTTKPTTNVAGIVCDANRDCIEFEHKDREG